MTDAEHQHELDFALQLDFDDILTNPILDIGARVWEDDRYQAFRVCYRSMRRIDDLVDDRKESDQPISPDEIDRYRTVMDAWTEGLIANEPHDEFQRELLDVMHRFRIPVWPWQRLSRAMTYDLTHDGFPSLLVFRRYTEGAAIAPASIFTHLCGIRPTNDGFETPPFDIRETAKDLALFSYFVHIVRDFQKDHLRGLNYFPDSMLRRYALSLDDLREIARGATIPDDFRRLVADYRTIAEYYRRRARVVLDRLRTHLNAQYQLSLEIIYQLYLQIFERIDPAAGRFTAEELMPTPDEVDSRLKKTISTFIRHSR